MFNHPVNCRWLFLALIFALSGVHQALPAVAVELPLEIRAQLDACNLNWDSPGPSSAASMPIGNGDIGLNVWVETNGDLLFYIGKTDAWGKTCARTTARC